MGTGPSASFRATFLDVSVLLTGFSELDLEATGVLDQYAALVEEIVDAIGDPTLLSSITALTSATDPAAAVQAAVGTNPGEALSLFLQNLTLLWYLGEWYQLPALFYSDTGTTRPAIDVSQIPSQLAYAQGLAWRVACAHPPGARPTGYGGWSLPPAVPARELPPIARGVSA